MSIFKTALTFSAAAYIVSLGLSSMVVSSDDADAEDFVYSSDLAVALGRANVPIYWSSKNQDARNVCSKVKFAGLTDTHKVGSLGDGSFTYIIICEDRVPDVDNLLSLIRHEAVHVAQFCDSRTLGFLGPLGLKQEYITDYARKIATSGYYTGGNIQLELEAYTIGQWDEAQVARLVDDHCNKPN